MRSRRFIDSVAVAVALTAALAACSSSTEQATQSSSSGPKETTTSTVPSATSSDPGTTGDASGSSVPTALDPCQLVTQQEASALAGASFGPGKEQTDSGNNTKRCVYGYQTANVFTVAVVQAASVADAQAAKEQFLAEVKQKVGSGIDVTQVPDFADGAVEMQATLAAGGTTVGASAIYALDGTVGFGFSDAVVGGPAPDNAALLAQASQVLSRLP